MNWKRELRAQAMKARLLRRMLWLAISCGALALNAQHYTIDWFTVDGGGGVSRGSRFSIIGSVGEAGPAQMSGTRFAIEGGFLGAAASVPPGLTIAHSATNTVILSWPASSGGYLLQQTTNLVSGVWTVVTNATVTANGWSQVVLAPPASMRFYRLAQLQPPELRIAATRTNAVVLSWPAGSGNYALQHTATFTPPNWGVVSGTPTQTNGWMQVVVSPLAVPRFYRLKHQ